MEGHFSTGRWGPPMSWLYIPTPFRLGFASSICERADVPFWNPWDSTRGDLNACFEDVALPLLSLALVIAVAPWVSRTASAARPSLQRHSPNRLDIVRHSLILFCGLLPLAFLIGPAFVQSLSLVPEQQLSLALSFLFFLVFLVLQHFASRRGTKQHPCLRLSLLVHFASQILKLQSAVRRWQQQGWSWESLLPTDVETAVFLLPELLLCVAFCLFTSDTVRRGAALMGPPTIELAAG